MLVRLSHFCAASPLSHYARLISGQTQTQFLLGIILKLKRQVSSTKVIFTSMQETQDYDQNKHQNLWSAYCCLVRMQINSNTVVYLDTDRKIISNDYRAAGIIVSSCLTSPIKNKAWRDRQNTVLGFDLAKYFGTSFSLNLRSLCWNTCWNEASKTFSFYTSILIRSAWKHTHKTW